MLLWSLFHYARSSRDVSLNTSRSWRRINRSSVENSPPCLPERTPRGTHHCLSTRHVGVHPILLPTRKIIKRELIFLVYCLNVYFSITILESSFYFTNWSYYITNTNNWHLHPIWPRISAESFTSHALWLCAVCFHLHIRSHTSWIIMYWKVKYKHEKCTHIPMERCTYTWFEIFSSGFLSKPFPVLRLNNPQLCTYT